MAEHKHGDMDTKVQQGTYDALIKFFVWAAISIVAIFVFLAIFAT